MKIKSKYFLIVICIALFMIELGLVLEIASFKNKNIKTGSVGLFQKRGCVNCNIMLVDIDILRADELPCYGYLRNTTPNICDFAKKSVIFKNNFSSARWTLPDMFSTITSLYPTFHRQVDTTVDKLSDNIPTLAEILHQNGYQTALVIDPFEATLNQRNGGFRGYDQILSTRDKPIEEIISDLSNKPQPWFIHYYINYLGPPYTLPDNVQFIENLKPPNGFSKTWTFTDFLRLLNSYIKKHHTQVFTKMAIDQYGSIILAPTKPNDVSVANLFYKLSAEPQFQNYVIDRYWPGFEAFTEKLDPHKISDVAYIRMLYDTKLKTLDDTLETFFQKLDSRPLSGKTVTVIMSDHGEEFGDHGNFSHNFWPNYHSEMFHTPLIINYPQSSDKQVAQPSSNMDIFPTLLDLTGIKIPDGLQGQSLISIVSDEKFGINRFILSENWDGIVLQNQNWLFYLPTEATNSGQSILYNKIDDPSESKNVAYKYSELTSTFYDQANLLRSYNPNPSFKNNSNIIFNGTVLDPEKLKRLQKEGYF